MPLRDDQMGVEKERMMEKEDNWQALAEGKGWRCAWCGQTLSREEFQAFENECSGCHQNLSRND